MPLVAGVDSSTQSCKVLIKDAETGRLVRTGLAPHPPGSEVDPEQWWSALMLAIESAGGLSDVAAISIAGQQHGMVCLDAQGEVIRPALLWNDTRSAAAADQLIEELGGGDHGRGASRWAQAIGTVPVASLTITKLRWLTDHEPHNAAKVAGIALPHDWLVWRLRGASSLETLVTDRSEASGTGYFDATSNTYRTDLLALALRRSPEQAATIALPRVLGPQDIAGRGAQRLGIGHLTVAPGCGDNAAAALALDLHPGQASISLGTSGVVATVCDSPVRDPRGLVASFADATGRHLALAVTLNAARVLEAAQRVLGVDHAELSRLALQAQAGAGGLVHVPYLDGERTPNLPQASGALLGMTSQSLTRPNYARAAFEGVLCLMTDALAAVVELGLTVEEIVLIGGAARSTALRRIAPQVVGTPVVVCEPGEYVADGAARQAAWVMAGAQTPPRWSEQRRQTMRAAHSPEVLACYRAATARLYPTSYGPEAASSATIPDAEPR